MRISLPAKFTAFLFAFFLLLTSYFLLLTSTIFAQTPVPPPGRIPCDENEVRDPEFHSLRPYQASPCGDSPKAVFCGNSITITETVSETTYDCSATEITVDEDIDKTYTVTLRDAELPILGNTELVKNSQRSTDELDDAQKVNEYVSWYLEGIIQKAEKGIDTPDEIVNFSGPVKKLLPSALQEFQRFKVLHAAGVKQTYTDSEGLGVDINPSMPGVQVRETFQHNQIVVCTTKNIFGINNPWLGTEKPIPCYDGNGDPAKGKKYRLVQWWEGKRSGLIDSVKKIPGWDGSERWSYKVPPFPWQFEKDIYYLKAYQEWRGHECFIDPIFKKLWCLDLKIPGLLELHTNAWADFYPYIPLGNTVDKAAKVPITNSANPQALGQTTLTINRPTEILEEPALFFAHTQDVAETSEFLNSSYIPKEGTSKEVDYTTTETDYDEKGQCRIVNVRSNPGDNLFPHVDPDVYQIYANFTINTIPCQAQCVRNKFGYLVKRCEGGASITLNTDTKTPNAREIFENTTAGSSSTFRRIFPKVQEGAPVSCIANMPAVTTANYAGFEAGGRQTSPATKPIDIKVTEPDGTTTGGDSKLYFPYLGSVYEYFLKAIQTALRPKGYGEPITDGQYCASTIPTECKVNVPDSAVPSKYLGSFKSNFIDLANRWSAKCPGPENNMAEECYNYVASEAKKAGVNPAFALTIWLNESGASNYCEGGSTTQDFGIRISSIYQNIVEQLKRFLGMAKQKLCSGVAGFSEPMHGWLSRFQSSAGVCNPSDTTATQYYYDVRDNTWSWVTGCSKAGKFGITWPTDMGCP